jgi:uncharacterized protein (TIGR03118 family)
LLLSTVAAFLSASAIAQSTNYVQTNIVSDGSVQAQKTDPTLINPWGISIGGKFWIDAAGSGFSIVDDASGNKAFAVTIPPAASTSPHGTPTGTVFNTDTTAFTIPGQGSATFIFGTLDGTIAAWNSKTPQAVTVASAAHAVYTGIVIDKNATGTFLLAANRAGGTVDVYDTNFSATHLAGSFSDPSLPAGFTPFGVHLIANNVYVTYGQINSQGKEVAGAGLGYINQFDMNGNFVKRAISQGNLNAPWGMALAPQGFGSLGGSLLVGNFGDGVINAYDPTTFALKGQVTNSSGQPVTNSGLWEIVFGAGTSTGTTAANAGDPNTLYFAAGINSGQGGLFGSVGVAQPAGSADFTFTSSSQSITVTNGQTGNLSLNFAAVNGFSGTVTLSCSGLPSGDACTFNPPSVTVSGTTPTTVSLAIATKAATPPSPPPSPYVAERTSGRFILAGLIPLGLIGFAGIRRRSALLRGLLMALICIATLGTLAGCSSNSNSAAPTNQSPPAPATSQVTVTATSGAISHTVSVSLTTN